MFASDEQTFKRFVAGQLAALRELTLFFAPQINSYKRYVEGSFAPTAVAWGHDNRTCSMRVVGHGQSLRVENRLPGADVNPYLALAAMIAAGLHGIDNELELEAAYEGNAYESDKPRVPDTMYEARDLFADSAIAREAFGQEVVDHYLNRARDRADGLRGGRDRLGEVPRLRASVSRGEPAPRSASAAPSRRCRWGAWDGARERLAAQLHAHGPGGRRAWRCCSRPTMRRPSAREMLDLLDGLCSPAASDIDPATYGAVPHPETRRPGLSATASSWRWRTRALERDMPVLGICRGMQMLNVALRRDARAAPARPAWRRPPPPHAGRVRRPRRATAGRARSRRARSARSARPVKSHHHQGVDELGEGLVAGGWSEPDETVEAIELPDKTYALGVLWHPEEDERSSVIGSLVDAARAYSGATA